MELVSWIKKQTGKISDKFNQYKFYVKQLPQIIDSSSVVSIQTFDSRDMTASIPCSYKWFTVRNGLTTQIPQFKGNTYICQPSDVGCLLQVQITSSDPQCTGTALLTYGPVKFDVLLKKQIEMSLSTGQAIFTIDINVNNIIKQCQLRVLQDKIIINHANSQTLLSFDYCMIEPKLQIIYKIPTKVRIIFSPKYFQDLQQFLYKLFGIQVSLQQLSRIPFIQINFNNRKAKDSFIFITKAFNTKKQLKSTAYVSNLQKQLDFTKITQKDNKDFNYIQHVSQLQRDITKLIQINGKNCMEKRIYLEENKKLQKQIEQIVSTYVKIIQEKFHNRQDFEKSFIVLKEKQEEYKTHKDQNQFKLLRELQDKVTYLESQNQRLKDKIQSINNGQKLTNSPFKRKSIFQGGSSSPVQTRTPVFLQSQLQSHQQVNLKKQLEQISLKYQHLKKDFANLQADQLRQRYFNKNKEEQFNLDKFDAKSVRSIKQKNNTSDNMSSSLVISKDSIGVNPQKLKFLLTTPKKSNSNAQESHTIASILQKQNANLRNQISQLEKQIESLTNQFVQKQQKYKKRISDMTQQLEMHKRNNDVLNRSQHLSMQMQEYNQQQQETLKKDNQYLRKQIDNYKQLCEKYMTDAKKYKQLKKQNEQKSLILQQAGL